MNETFHKQELMWSINIKINPKLLFLVMYVSCPFPHPVILSTLNVIFLVLMFAGFYKVFAGCPCKREDNNSHGLIIEQDHWNQICICIRRCWVRVWQWPTNFKRYLTLENAMCRWYTSSIHHQPLFDFAATGNLWMTVMISVCQCTHLFGPNQAQRTFRSSRSIDTTHLSQIAFVYSITTTPAWNKQDMQTSLH